MKISLQHYLDATNKPKVLYHGQLVLDVKRDEKYVNSTRYILKCETYSIGAKKSDTQLEIVKE